MDDPPPGPGFYELDTTAHCGHTTKGEYLHTLTATDPVTGWTLIHAIRNNTHINIKAGMDWLQQHSPVPIAGMDFDGTPLPRQRINRSINGTRTRHPAAPGTRPQQRRDRGRDVRQPRNRQDPRVQHPHQTGVARPHQRGHLGLRERSRAPLELTRAHQRAGRSKPGHDRARRTPVLWSSACAVAQAHDHKTSVPVRRASELRHLVSPVWGRTDFPLPREAPTGSRSVALRS